MAGRYSGLFGDLISNFSFGGAAPNPMNVDGQVVYPRRADVGSILGRNLGSALFGTDYRSDQEKLASELQNVDISTDSGFKEFSDLTMKFGSPRQKMDLLEMQRKRNPSIEDIMGQINPQQYTPASLEEFRQHFETTGDADYSKLKEIDVVTKAMEQTQGNFVLDNSNTRAKHYLKLSEHRRDVNMMEKLLGDIRTGGFAKITMEGKKYIAALLGRDPGEEVGKQEAFNALANKFALIMRQPGDDSGGLTGNTSNRDLSFLIESVPGLTKSKKGNEILLAMMNDMFRYRDYMMEEERKITENFGRLASDGQTKLPPLDMDQRLVEAAQQWNDEGNWSYTTEEIRKVANEGLANPETFEGNVSAGQSEAQDALNREIEKRKNKKNNQEQSSAVDNLTDSTKKKILDRIPDDFKKQMQEIYKERHGVPMPDDVLLDSFLQGKNTYSPPVN